MSLKIVLFHTRKFLMGHSFNKKTNLQAVSAILHMMVQHNANNQY